MPAQKRSPGDLDEESAPEEQPLKEEEEDGGGDGDGEVEEAEPEPEEEGEGEGEKEDDDDEDEDEEEDDDDEEDQEEDSNGSESSGDGDGNGEKDQIVTVNLSDVRKEVQCPICLGIIRKTRTVMECLHRFCRECIDKSMRMGNNECPACRTHCASRRSLRDDPNFDAIIATLYHDIDKYEAEELAFREEEKTRNKQIQESIAQTYQRQNEALARKRSAAKGIATVYRRTRGRRRGRGGRGSRAIELQGSEDDEDVNVNEETRDSSSADEHDGNAIPKRPRRWSGQRFSQSSAVEAGGECDGNNDAETSRAIVVASPGQVSTPDMLAWGRGGARSHTRYGSVFGSSKGGRSNRIARLVDHLRNSQENLDKLDVQFMLVPVDKETTPSLEEPFICCEPIVSIGQLCQFVALQTPLKAEEVEILIVKEPHVNPSTSSDDPLPTVEFDKDKLQAVEENETLGELLKNGNLCGNHLVMAYRQKI